MFQSGHVITTANSPHMTTEPRQENCNPLLTKGEIAKRLRVSERTADRWIACGIIPPADVDATKLTKRWC